MKNETRQCQNCKKDFVIEPDDFSFYKKMKVPPPTFCPECRLQRRLSWRNGWRLYRKTDDHNGKEIFSSFPKESPVRIYEKEFWNSDSWNPIDYGKNFNFNKPFFEQFAELLREVPLPAHPLVNVINSSYCTNANDIKNCYMVSEASYTEDSAYLIWDQASKQSFDSHMTNNCELGYGNVNTVNCYQTFFSVDCEDCVEVTLCKDCIGCNNCFGSVSLRNKSYCIFNQPYTKEEYLIKLSEFDIASYKKLKELKNKSYDNWKKYPQKYIHGRQNLNVSTDYIYESKNAKDCYRIRGVENSKFTQNILTGPVKDCYDYSNYGDNAELVYECMVVGSGVSNVKFTDEGYPNINDLTYCLYCNKSSYLFGCISLRNKKYCVLNKQYSKEEYDVLVPKIIEHMRKTSEYGEFFPSSLSPFPYYATEANEFYPLSEEEARNKNFVWYEIPKQSYNITLKNENIPDNIKNVERSILNEVIECEHQGKCSHECVGAFKIVELELDFCKRVGLPIPRLCPNCRHYERLAQRNTMKVWRRKCMREGCNNEFETSYSPERPEIIYCEKCYQQEVF